MVVIELLNSGNKVIKWITRSEVSMGSVGDAGWSVGYAGVIILILAIAGIILLIKNLNKKK